MSEYSFLKNSCLIVAHPDDEILWFSSIIKQVDAVVICYLGNPAIPGRGAARKRVIDHYPLPHIKCLGLDVPLTKQWSNGNNMVENDFGIELPKEASAIYRESYFQLYDLLNKQLKGYDNIFTHNPWGEYGHEMHVQVHKVLRDLLKSHHADLWFSNYVSANTLPLALQYRDKACVEPITLTTDTALSEEVKGLYEREDCWTVSGGHTWATNESFNRAVKPDEAYQSKIQMFNLNHVNW